MRNWLSKRFFEVSITHSSPFQSRLCTISNPKPQFWPPVGLIQVNNALHELLKNIDCSEERYKKEPTDKEDSEKVGCISSN